MLLRSVPHASRDLFSFSNSSAHEVAAIFLGIYARVVGGLVDIGIISASPACDGWVYGLMLAPHLGNLHLSSGDIFLVSVDQMGRWGWA